MNGTNFTTQQTSTSLSWTSWTQLSELLFGVLTNFANILVFLNPKLKDTSYTYMLVISITNLSYQGFLFVSTLFNSCVTCATYRSYFSALYNIAITSYFTSSLAIYRIAIECTLSFHTYCVLTRKNWTSRVSSKLILASLFVASLVIYAQLPFTSSIVSFSTNHNGTTTRFFSQSTDFGRSVLAKTIAIVNTSVRLFLAVIVLTILNVLNVIEFRKRFKSRRVGLLLPLNNTQSINGTMGKKRNKIETKY
jgi:hypothetical protein